MSEVKWIKIVTDIFDDEKILLIESMPDADKIIVIWFKLLCLAGKQNNSGVFLMNGRIAYTDEMFATIFRRPLNTVRLALKTFEQFGMIEIINNTVTIPNWSKHQNLDRIEAKNQYMREYMRKYREKQKALTDGNADSKANSEAKVSRPDKIREDKKEDEIREGEKKRKRFTPPTVDEAAAYAEQMHYTGFDAQRFIDYYESNGWKVGRNPMKEWKAAVRSWVSRDRQGKPGNPALEYQQRDYTNPEQTEGTIINLWE